MSKTKFIVAIYISSYRAAILKTAILLVGGNEIYAVLIFPIHT